MGVVREAFEEFWQSGVSKAGVVLLAILTAISIYVVLTMPMDFGTRYWNNPLYWADNPKAVPPAWVNHLSKVKHTVHTILIASQPVGVSYKTGVYLKYYNMTYNYVYDDFPSFITLKISNVTFYSEPPVIQLYITRPDGFIIPLYTLSIPSQPSGLPPYRVFSKGSKRILLSGDLYVARALSNFLYEKYGVFLGTTNVMQIGHEQIVFGDMVNKTYFKPLKGKYIISIVLLTHDLRDSIGRVEFVIGGRVYGLMGTDTLGRDLAKGLLFGFPVALLIGFVTSIFTTIIGASLGIISGYVGGKIDELIQRFADIVNNVPLLPILIFLCFIFKGNLWVMIAALIAFGWPGLTIVVRSMVLQIKSAQFVEAAISLGASKWRIMARHIFPNVAPFILAQLIFFTPSAILSEAALSFLGLGDPRIPTWGQILEYGFRNQAIFLGYWWWILPPGILIIISAVTFVFIALGLEPVVNPRLRRWR